MNEQKIPFFFKKIQEHVERKQKELQQPLAREIKKNPMQLKAFKDMKNTLLTKEGILDIKPFKMNNREQFLKLMNNLKNKK
jgi:hypothetical protein